MKRAVSATLLALTVAALPARAALVISNAATKHVQCSAGVCTSTAMNAVLNAGDLQTMLAGADVTLNTGGGAASISVKVPLTWASKNRLTLNADNGIAIEAAVVVESTGAMTITPSSGALSFTNGGSIAFWDNASSLIIAGQSYTLVSDLLTLDLDVQANPSGSFALAKDYDASADGTYLDYVVEKPFAGSFEGLGHVISNFKIMTARDSNTGMFYEVDGSVRDIAFSNGTLDCTQYAIYCGLLAGDNKGTLANVSVAVTLYGDTSAYIGSLAGGNEGTINRVTVNFSYTRWSYAVGGVVGADSGTIQNVSVSGIIQGNASFAAGGIVGLEGGSISDVHASVKMDMPSSASVGGVAGYADGTILRCSWFGSIKAKTSAGGIVGHALVTTIDSCFSTGHVRARHNAGGIAGYADNTSITNSYATGTVLATYPSATSGGLVGYFHFGTINTSWSGAGVTDRASTLLGGVVGDVDGNGTAASDYWDLDTSGISDPSKGAGNVANFPGLAGLSDTQLKSGLPSGFDSAIWGQNPSINNGYPYLLANPPPQ
ncbi:MAG: hypothetical protein JO261_15030 [Alphaproteobacteria bacterium]|nr:hypothetical protein [Alphaproteobacteria bacterium]MBV9695010.1 hypothetical protein [Alphaproteobacteria bacterium]